MRARLIVVLGLILLTAGAAPPVTASTDTTGPVHSAGTTCAFPVTVTDATGTPVTVAGEPQRIVTLSPSAAQIMWEIGGKSKVVGVSQYAAYLEGAGSRTNVSGAGNAYVDVETVITLEPDLVLAPNTIPNDTVQKLRRAELTVYRYRPAASITDIANQTRLTGTLTGECAGAQRTTARMRSQLERVHSAVSGADRPRVLYTFFGYTAGKDTFVHQIITTAGGVNVAAEAGISGYKLISEETIIDQNPQWIVRNDQQPTVPHSQAYNSTDAVQQGNVVVLNRNYISQPAPRVVQPITTLARTLHPDAYAATNVTQGTSATVSASAAGTSAPVAPASTNASTPAASASPSTPGTTAATTPGFGVGVACVGLLSAFAALAVAKHER
jgi:iron complex transport system substrate-binding protein